MHFLLQSFIFMSILLNIISTIENWNYHNLGPDVWSDTYPSCAGHSQSPINIQTTCTTYQSFSSFRFSSSYNQTHDFKLRNNGHTIIGTYIDDISSPLILTGGGLNRTFEFVNFHLHWGENYKSGSEHHVNGMKYAGEIHFVHRNPQTSEYAVLSFFMQSSRPTNTTENPHVQRIDNLDYNTSIVTTNEWEKYFIVTKNLHDTNSSTERSLSLGALMGENLNDFWRYEGSLTTPPCTEGIMWTIFRTPIMFNDNDINIFRENIVYEGYRDPQSLYDRIVYRSFPTETPVSSMSDNQCCLNSSNHLKNKFILLIFNIILFVLKIIQTND